MNSSNSEIVGDSVLEKPFFPFLISVYPFLYLYSENSDIASVSDLLATCLVSLSAATFLFLLLSKLLSSRSKGAVAAAAAMLFACTHGYIYQTLMQYAWTSTAGDFVSRRLRALNFHFELALVELLLVLLLILLLRRVKQVHAAVPLFLNVFSFSLVVLALIGSAANVNSGDKGSGERAAAASQQENQPDELPDIYYVILDGYGRQDKLLEYFDFDNSAFTDWLRGHGFFVSENSRSNFYWTYLSLASSLNLEYITYLSERLGRDSRNRTIPYRMIKYNKLAEMLRGLGYRHYHVQSTWGATMHNPAADQNIACSGATFNNEFYRTAVEVSILSAFPHAVSFDLAQCHLQNFENLAAVASEPGPKFVFAHFIPPHHPYLFDKDGHVLRNATVSNQFEFQKLLWGDREAYVQQIQFVNGKVEEVVGRILSSSDQPPVIVLQSDHGPTILDESQESTDEVRLSNFTAVYLPDSAKIFPDEITPVNIFRIILQHYFGFELPTLENRHYKSGYHSPFDFEEVKFN